MDDLMNKVGALIEEHVKSEVEARAAFTFPSKDEIRRGARALGSDRDKYRTMWEQLHRAQGEDLDAKEQLKELLSALGLNHFTRDRSVIAGALELTRKRDARLCSERDEAWAARDTAEKRYQEVSGKVRELEAKLLEVRKAVGEKVPAESVKAPPKPSEFQKGDLVARHMRGPGCWGTVQAVDGDYVQVFYPQENRFYHHMERALTRKPIEKGDRVRGIHSTFVDVVIGTSDDGSRCHFKVAPFRETRFLIAIAP